MKGFIGSANIDTNSRLCMASSVAGHKRAFGSDTVPGCYDDLEAADVVVLAGASLAWCHPVLFQRIVAAGERHGAKIVVIDPRQTATSDSADIYLALAPGSDLALFNGLLAHLDAAGVQDRDYVEAHTSGLAAALDAAQSTSLSEFARRTGLAPSVLRSFYDLFAANERVVTLYSQGVNQSIHGADNVNAIINCHLFTGRIDRPGMVPFSVTGQPNAMGGREIGGLANQLACHMDIENTEHRALVGKFWSAPRLAGNPGFKAIEMFEAVRAGRIKALWIMASNPLDSLPDADAARAALDACPFVVVSDVTRHTDTTVHADGFDFDRPSEICAEHAALSGYGNNGARDFDISAQAGISPVAYENLQPYQWPLAGEPGPSRFFADGNFYTPDRRARFIATPTRAPTTAPSTAFPPILNTGRIRDLWHTMTRTGKSARFMRHLAEPFVEINPQDATDHGLRDTELAHIRSTLGSVVVRIVVTGR